MRLWMILLLWPVLASLSPAADITINRVIGPEFPGEYKHPATMTELANGDLYIAYYGGEGEYQGDTAVYGMRLVKGSTQWTTPQIIADTPNRSEGNGAIWHAWHEDLRRAHGEGERYFGAHQDERRIAFVVA